METQNFEIFLKKFEIEFYPYPECPYPEKRNQPSFVKISPTLVIDSYINGKVFMSTTAWKPKNFNFFSKKFENEF